MKRASAASIGPAVLGADRNAARGRSPAHSRIHLFVRRSLAQERLLRLSDHADVEHRVQDMSNGAEPLAIVNAVAGLAKCLNMISTAEGVETQQQMDTVQSIGCAEMQGYLFSRARPAKEIGQFFSSTAVAAPDVA